MRAARVTLGALVGLSIAGLALGRVEPVAAQAGAKPDQDMQSVLDQLGSLGGKPIEKLTPAEACKQPTPADAVLAVLKHQGKPTTPQPVGKVEDRMIQGATATPRRSPWAARAPAATWPSRWR